MDLIAARGYDVYLVDIRGYGRSTRPPEMSLPPEASQPIVSTEIAVRDFGTAVDHVRKRRGVARINLMGWSWGTAIAGQYTSENNAKVERLVLFAPLWIFRKDAVIAPAPDASTTNPLPLGAYRLVSKEVAKARWLEGVPQDERADRGDMGDRSGCHQPQPADAARAQWRDRRRARHLGHRQGLL
jgi:pimeloyl-ACP methyl ester carboxylesterase